MSRTKKPFRIGRSRTGLGLFATEPIAKRTFIVEYSGRLLNNEQAEAMEAKNSKYLYELNSRRTIDGSGRRNIGRYANHSCRPNCETDRRKGKVFIRALKNIKPGEEITYNYGRDYVSWFIKPYGCKCEKCIEQRRQERSAKLLATKRRKARAAKKAASSGKSKSRKSNARKSKS
jgi:SET domain-containing protein